MLWILKDDSIQKEAVDMPVVENAEEVSADHLPFARRYLCVHCFRKLNKGCNLFLIDIKKFLDVFVAINWMQWKWQCNRIPLCFWRRVRGKPWLLSCFSAYMLTICENPPLPLVFFWFPLWFWFHKLVKIVDCTFFQFDWLCRN